MYIGTPPQSGFISQEANQYFTGLTQNYIDLNQSISSLSSVIVLVNGVVQENSTMSLTSSTRITLGDTLVSADKVTCIYVAKISSTQAPATGSVTSDMLSGSIANSKLANSSITLNGSAVSLGGSLTGIGEDNTPYFSAKGSGTQTASNNANTTLQFNTLVDSLDSASGYNTSSHDYTVQSGGAGLWYLRAGFYFSGASSFSEGNQVQIQLAKNNADFLSANVYYGGQTDGWIYTHGLAKLAVGNTLKVICYQNTGGNITAYLNNFHNSVFAGFRVKSI